MRLIPLVLMLTLAAALSAAADSGHIEKEDRHSEAQRAANRRALLQAIPESDTLLIPASVPTVARIVVFTDTDCPYCALLHQRHELLSQLGVEIQYLFYPRSGPLSASFDQAVAVWCSNDRVAAIGRVFQGAELPVTKCTHPVMEHYELARKLNLLGTPAVISADGSVHYGLPSRDDVLDLLQQSGRTIE